MAKPAKAAMGKLTSPPTMAAAKPLIERRVSRFGFDDTTSEASAMPAMPAAIEPPTQETTARRFEDTPSKLATSGSVAEARMARPVDVKRKKANVSEGEEGDDADDADALVTDVHARQSRTRGCGRRSRSRCSR